MKKLLLAALLSLFASFAMAQGAPSHPLPARDSNGRFVKSTTHKAKRHHHHRRHHHHHHAKKAKK